MVHLRRHLAVGTENIEVSRLKTRHHVVDDLIRPPCTRTMFAVASGGHAGDQQMRGDGASGCIPKVVLQEFRKGF